MLTPGCSKLNPLFQDAAGETDSGKDSAGGSVTGPASTSSDTTDSASSDPDTFGSESDGSSTAFATGSSDSGSSSDSTGEWETDTGTTRPFWTEDCILPPAAEICLGVAVTERGFNCLPMFPSPAGPECGQDFASLVDVLLDAGSYVIGTVDPSDAQYSAWRPPGGPLMVCQQENSTFVVPPGPTSVVEIQISTEFGRGFPPLWLRSTDSLCATPPDCCTPNVDLDAVAACSHAGIRECVVDANPMCNGAWDFLCPDTAMFICGANCT